jgi:hypothetical protein
MHSESCKKAHSSRFCRLNFLGSKKWGKIHKGIMGISNENDDCSSATHFKTILRCDNCLALYHDVLSSPTQGRK